MTRPNGEGYEVLDDPPISLSPVSAQPPWHGQPEPVAVLIEMGRPASTAVQVVGACAYRDGVVLRFVVRIRETPRELRRRLFAQLEFTSGRGMLNMGLVPGGLRWGFEFSDGRCVTSLDEDPWVSMPPGVDPATWRPNSPVLMGLGKPTGWAGSWSRIYGCGRCPRRAHCVASAFGPTATSKKPRQPLTPNRFARPHHDHATPGSTPSHREQIREVVQAGVATAPTSDILSIRPLNYPTDSPGRVPAKISLRQGVLSGPARSWCG